MTGEMAPSRGWLCSPPAVALGRVALLLTALQPVMPLSPDSSDTLLRPASLRRGLLLGLLTFLFFDEILVFGERHLTSAATVRRARCPRPDLRVWRDMPAEEAQAPLIARLDNFCNCKYAFLQLDNFCNCKIVDYTCGVLSGCSSQNICHNCKHAAYTYKLC